MACSFRYTVRHTCAKWKLDYSLKYFYDHLILLNSHFINFFK